MGLPRSGNVRSPCPEQVGLHTTAREAPSTVTRESLHAARKTRNSPPPPPLSFREGIQFFCVQEELNTELEQMVQQESRVWSVSPGRRYGERWTQHLWLTEARGKAEGVHACLNSDSIRVSTETRAQKAGRVLMRRPPACSHGFPKAVLCHWPRPRACGLRPSTLHRGFRGPADLTLDPACLPCCSACPIARRSPSSKPPDLRVPSVSCGALTRTALGNCFSMND